MPEVPRHASTPYPCPLQPHLDPQGSSPGSVHPDDVQVAKVDALLVEPGAAGATARPQVGASGTGQGRWLLWGVGGSGLALACMHRREREVERWVRAPGTARMGDPPGSSSCIIEEVGILTAQELRDSPGKPQRLWVGKASGCPGTASPLIAQPHAATVLRGSGPCMPSAGLEGTAAPGGGTQTNPEAAAAAEARGLTFVQGHEQG